MSGTSKTRKRASVFKLVLALLAVGTFVLGSFTLAASLSEFATLKGFIASYGYLTVFFIAIIAGLNVIVPVPAATFVPIFTEAGLFLPAIIFMLILGTTIADLVGFGIGLVSRDYVEYKHPKFFNQLQKIHNNNAVWLMPAVVAYAAFIPLPNELILIPLAVMGSRLKTIVIAVIIGTTIHQTLLAYGFESVFAALF